ncbi:hypothetical protein M0R45_011657 [Rubus argutus]|uniref:FAS1 domain-containing protein n=1 Tax=Rubus argutus TaxID=59490 RepID=A0AAW1YBE5_RUBAR
METTKTTASIYFFFILIILSISSCSAFNITKLLGKESDFSTFNKYLSQTKLADQINERSTITVLAVDNGAIGGLPSDDSFVQKSIMSVHVILDYYDKEKLTKLARHNKSATLTSLFQTSGVAQNQQGFIRLSPTNISVLQVSSVIEVPNINASPSPDKAPAPKKGKSPSPSDDTRRESRRRHHGLRRGRRDAPSPSKHKYSTPPKPADDDDDDDMVTSDSPSSTPAPAPSKSDARAPAAEMGVGVVVMGFVSVAFF